MQPYHCVVVDDEALARELIESYINQLQGFKLVASCASAIEASSVLKQQPVDLMFLDIEMPVLKGVDFYQKLSDKPKVIFTTAYRDYALEGFDLQAVDYLLKPISFSRFFQAIEHFQSLQPRMQPVSSVQPIENHYIFIKENRKQVRLDLADILYIQSLKDYVQIYTERGKHIVKYSISSFAAQLDERFIRVHRSYIVNKGKIDAIAAQEIEIGQTFVPIGESYKPLVSKLLIS